MEKFSVERKDMSEKIPAEFVTDWKKIRYWLWACRRGDEFCARSLSENKSENRNENLTATAKKKQVHNSIHSCER